MIANSSEDCLYLNVVTPEWPASGKLPVIVYVHGGGNYAGGAWEHLAKGVTLQNAGVVVVTVNYRLGVFGFFAHPGLSAESPEHASGNYGLQDLVAALRWVKANIAQFGGDPGNVTMMGQSAGALDICVLLASDEARGFISKAIVESAPGVGAPDTPTLSQAEASGAALAERLGCADIGALRSLDAQALLAGAEKSRMRGSVDVDGWILKEPPARTYASGREAKVPMLIGTNARESSFKGTPGELRNLVNARYGPRRPGGPGALRDWRNRGGDFGPALRRCRRPVPHGHHVQVSDLARRPVARLRGGQGVAVPFQPDAEGQGGLRRLALLGAWLRFRRDGVAPAGRNLRSRRRAPIRGDAALLGRFRRDRRSKRRGARRLAGIQRPADRAYLELRERQDRALRDMRRPYLDLFTQDYEARLGP